MHEYSLYYLILYVFVELSICRLSQQPSFSYRDTHIHSTTRIKYNKTENDHCNTHHSGLCALDVCVALPAPMSVLGSRIMTDDSWKKMIPTATYNTGGQSKALSVHIQAILLS